MIQSKTSNLHSLFKDKPTKLFIGITAFFVANALIAECIGGKIFSLEKLLVLIYIAKLTTKKAF